MTRCEICEEPIPTDKWGFYLGEVGEFWIPEDQDSVIAHASCGLDRGLEMA